MRIPAKTFFKSTKIKAVISCNVIHVKDNKTELLFSCLYLLKDISFRICKLAVCYITYYTQPLFYN